MLPDPQSARPATDKRMCRWPDPRWIMETGVLALALVGLSPARGQDQKQDQATAVSAVPGETAAVAGQSDPIGFEADQVAYAYDNEVVTANGNVVLRRNDQSVRADTVTWNRKTGQILASGNIRLVDADGNQLFTDKVELTDELKAGAMQNLLLALRDGGRLAAMTGERDASGKVILTHAA